MKINKLIGITLISFVFFKTGAAMPPADRRLALDTVKIGVPMGGNAFRVESSGKMLPGTDPEKTAGGTVTEKGIINWSDKGLHFKTFLRFAEKGKIKVWLKLRVPEGESRIELKAAGKAVKLTVSGNQVKTWYAGEFKITEAGYLDLMISGLTKTGHTFAEVTDMELSGVTPDQVTFVKNNEGNYFYWGRRGPSVHLNYAMPDNVQAEWFYNEVKVPVGMDVTGSYFMANGFGEGYFGMQVNSATERRILFSVWSPFQTDHPDQIPEDQKIKMLSKGAEVHTGEFGNEGSGGQSFLRFNWKAGESYRFLLRALPGQQNQTTYTAWFYDAEKSVWRLIASFKRPGKSTYLTHLHSFLENFVPETGIQGRQVEFTNQWIRTAGGKWIALSKAKFTGDQTARKAYRMDYAGGVTNGSFFLRNCGFFNDYTVLDQVFERPLTAKTPDITLENLPE